MAPPIHISGVQNLPRRTGQRGENDHPVPTVRARTRAKARGASLGDSRGGRSVRGSWRIYRSHALCLRFTRSLFACSHMGEVVETQPTIGSNVESVKHNNVHFVRSTTDTATARPGDTARSDVRCAASCVCSRRPVRVGSRRPRVAASELADLLLGHPRRHHRRRQHRSRAY